MKLPYLKIEQAVENDDSGFFRDLMAAHPDLPLPALLAAIEPVADPDDPDFDRLVFPLTLDWEKWVIGRKATGLAVFFLEEGVFANLGNTLTEALEKDNEVLIHAVALRHPLGIRQVREVAWSAFFFDNKDLARPLFETLPIDWDNLGEQLVTGFLAYPGYVADLTDREWAFFDDLAMLGPEGFGHALVQWADAHAHRLTGLMARREKEKLEEVIAPAATIPAKVRLLL